MFHNFTNSLNIHALAILRLFKGLDLLYIRKTGIISTSEQKRT